METTEVKYFRPIPPKKLAQFKKLLTEDKQENIFQRYSFFESVDEDMTYMRMGYVPLVLNNFVTTIFVQGTDKPSFAFSIGLFYYFDLPEIMVFAQDKEPVEMENMVASLVEMSLKRQEKEKPQFAADEVVSFKEKGKKYEFKIKMATPEFLKENPYGYGEDFYRNYMDIAEFSKTHIDKIIIAELV